MALGMEQLESMETRQKPINSGHNLTLPPIGRNIQSKITDLPPKNLSYGVDKRDKKWYFFNKTEIKKNV